MTMGEQEWDNLLTRDNKGKSTRCWTVTGTWKLRQKAMGDATVAKLQVSKGRFPLSTAMRKGMPEGY